MNEVIMLGAGAWGTAIAKLLAENGQTVHLWCYEQEVASQIAHTKINSRYLPGVKLPQTIIPFTHLDLLGQKKDALIFIAIPVKFLRAVLNQVQPFVTSAQRWCILSKGIENDTLLFPSALVQQIIDENAQIAVLSGPSFAVDVAGQQLTAVQIAATHAQLAAQVQQLVTNDYFKTYVCDDLIGLEVGAALKNIIALGLGILDGAKISPTTRAYVLTLGLHEMAKLAQKLGGKAETIFGLAGVGDLFLTASSTQSKNFSVGQLIGQGSTMQELANKGVQPEGFNTALSVYQLTQKQNSALPVCTGIYQIVYEDKKIADFLQSLQ